jgi:FlaA1/EpsC-like NDP-sugar epimerase
MSTETGSRVDTPSPARETGARAPDVAIRLGLDLSCWIVGLLLALGIRFGFSPTAAHLRSVLLFAPLLLLLQAIIGDFLGVYRRRWAAGDIDELLAVAGSTLLATAAGTAFNALLDDPPVPQSIPLAGGILALLAILAVRSVRRSLAERTPAA